MVFKRRMGLIAHVGLVRIDSFRGFFSLVLGRRRRSWFIFGIRNRSYVFSSAGEPGTITIRFRYCLTRRTTQYFEEPCSASVEICYRNSRATIINPVLSYRPLPSRLDASDRRQPQPRPPSCMQHELGSCRSVIEFKNNLIHFDFL